MITNIIKIFTLSISISAFAADDMAFGFYDFDMKDVPGDLLPFSSGKTVNPRESDFADHLELAANQGNIAAQYRFGMTLYKRENFSQACHYLKLAADQGHILAAHQYAVILEQDKGEYDNTKLVMPIDTKSSHKRKRSKRY